VFASPTSSRSRPRGCSYAKRSKTSRIEWAAFTQKYFVERPTLAAVLLLVDASIPPQPADLEVAHWLAEAQVRV